jgi:hypothetical protein
LGNAGLVGISAVLLDDGCLAGASWFLWATKQHDEAFGCKSGMVLALVWELVAELEMVG